jgi:hypothetical protein
VRSMRNGAKAGRVEMGYELQHPKIAERSDFCYVCVCVYVLVCANEIDFM